VDDVEALLAKAVSRSRFAASLRADERDDLLAWLFEVAWKLSETFDPNRGSFSSFLYCAAQRRAIDWQRSHYRTRWQFAGRTYERPRPQLLSLDDGDNRDLLGGTVRARTSDSSAGWDSDLGGFLGERDRSRSRDHQTLGLKPPRRAAG
jgi:DNA-directed RNA polymerase specialized sigma24 family protein